VAWLVLEGNFLDVDIFGRKYFDVLFFLICRLVHYWLKKQNIFFGMGETRLGLIFAIRFLKEKLK